MGFEINTRMKFKSVDENFKKNYGVSLALSFENYNFWTIGEHRLSELSSKTGGVVQVTDDMTVGEFRKEMFEQFGGTAEIWVKQYVYKGRRGGMWYMKVPDNVKLCDASQAKAGEFVHAPIAFGLDGFETEEQYQNRLGRIDLEEVEKKVLKKAEWNQEIEKEIRKTVSDLELFDIEGYIEEFKEKLKKARKKNILIMIYTIGGIIGGIVLYLSVAYLLREQLPLWDYIIQLYNFYVKLILLWL